MKYEDDYEKEADVERGVTRHTADRDYGTHEGTRFHCSSCGKKNVNHYLRLGTAGHRTKYKTAEARKEYAKKNPGTFCYLEGKSKTCEPCLQVKRENTKKFGRKTKKQLADERDTLRAIIARLQPDYQPQTKAEADALGIKWKEEKKEEIKEKPKPKFGKFKLKEEQKKVHKKSKGKRKLLVLDSDSESDSDESVKLPCERCEGDGCGDCIDE